MGSVIWIFQTELYEILSVTLPLWPAACGSGSNPALQEEVQGIGLWFPPGVLPQVHEEFLSSHTVGSLPHVTPWANPAPPITGPTGGYLTGIPHSHALHQPLAVAETGLFRAFLLCRAAPQAAYNGNPSHPLVTVQDWTMKHPHLMGRAS